jgi:hypothetical protein
VVIPEHLRYRILHNQIDVVLSAALRARTDIVVARVSMPLAPPQSDDPIAEGTSTQGAPPLSESPR